MLDTSTELRENLEILEQDIADAEGLFATILVTRRDLTWTAMFETTLELAGEVATQQDAGKDVSGYRDSVLVMLETFPDESYGAVDRLARQIVYPSPNMEPSELVARDQELVRTIRDLDRIYAALVVYVELAGRFDLDR